MGVGMRDKDCRGGRWRGWMRCLGNKVKGIARARWSFDFGVGRGFSLLKIVSVYAMIGGLLWRQGVRF